MIEFQAVTKQYDDGTTAVRSLDLRVEDGQITVFVGPSGCGKTTSLRMINRMIDATSGRILIDGKDIGWFILDSGAEVSVIDKGAADEIKLASVGHQPLTGVGGNVMSSFRPIAVTKPPKAMFWTMIPGIRKST